MEKGNTPILELIAVIALVVIATTVVFLLFPSMKNEAHAAWAQAIFGAGAIASTVWFATAEARRRRHDAETLARIAVAGILIKVSRVANSVDATIDTLKDEFVRGYGLDYDSLVAEFEDAGMWEDDEILPLIVLPKGVAANLAAARSQIRHVVLMMKRMQRQTASNGPKNTDAFDHDLIQYLETIRAGLMLAQAECRAFNLKMPSR